MILEIARNLDDSGLDLLRRGHSCLDFSRIERRRLRNACARAEQQHEKHYATAQTKPDDVVGRPVSSNLTPVCHGSRAFFLAEYWKTLVRQLGRHDGARLPIWTSILKNVNPPLLLGDCVDDLRLRVRL